MYPTVAHLTLRGDRKTKTRDRFSFSRRIVILLLVLCGNFLVPIDAEKITNANMKNICRENSLDTKEPIATADIIVIGSGPGGTGFLYRFIRQKPNMTVLWIEKGRDFLATNWPKDIADVDGAVLTPIPRTNKKLEGYAWNNFGGGDAGNSGGPNYNGLELERADQRSTPYQPVDVVKLRNNSLIPLTPTWERWVTAFEQAGYENEGPIYSRQTDVKRVGQMSSLRTPDGRGRLLLANDLRYSDENNIDYVHARVTSIIHEKVVDEQGRVSLHASGVRGVRVAQDDQGEYGGCVTWRANIAVVLAGGVFNSFDLLVESGLGPEEALDVRGVPEDWRFPNEQVGKGVGDEFPSVFLSVEPDAQDQFGAEARLVADTPDGTGSYEMWGHGVHSWLRFENVPYNNLLGRFLPRRFPGASKLLKRIFGRVSFISASVFHEPNMTLIATPKPLNATSSPNNPLGMRLNDSMIEFTKEKCASLTALLEPFKYGVKLQRKAKKKPSFARFLIAITSKLGILNILHPNVITAQNVNTFTGKGRKSETKCSMNQVASYYHFYGGNANAVDGNYTLQGTQNLFISDASVIGRLVPGGPSTAIMEQGMKVGDALIGTID